MSGGKDENILSFSTAGPCGRIMLHFIEIKRCHHICDAQRSTRVSGFGYSNHPDDVPADL